MAWIKNLTPLFLLLSSCSSNTHLAVGNVAEYSERSVAEREVSEARFDVADVFLYLPNRLFDLADIVRARLRIGPGFSGTARVGQPAAAIGGEHQSVYLGLPGPRQDSLIPWPGGIEALSEDRSPFTPKRRSGISPGYSPTEAGVGFQLGIVGIDLGFDPVEVGDFFTGFVLIDLREDDL